MVARENVGVGSRWAVGGIFAKNRLDAADVGSLGHWGAVFGNRFVGGPVWMGSVSRRRDRFEGESDDMVEPGRLIYVGAGLERLVCRRV